MSDFVFSDNDFFPLINDQNENIALIDGVNEYSYSKINAQINAIANILLCGQASLNEERIALFLPGSLEYVTSMHAIWRAGIFLKLSKNINQHTYILKGELSCL